LKRRSNTQSNGTFDLNFIACKFIMRKSEIAIKTKEVKKKSNNNIIDPHRSIDNYKYGLPQFIYLLVCVCVFISRKNWESKMLRLLSLTLSLKSFTI